MNVDVAAKIHYLETELRNVLMSEKQHWRSLIADSLVVIYALEISNIIFLVGNHYKPQQKWRTVI